MLGSDFLMALPILQIAPVMKPEMIHPESTTFFSDMVCGHGRAGICEHAICRLRERERARASRDERQGNSHAAAKR